MAPEERAAVELLRQAVAALEAALAAVRSVGYGPEVLGPARDALRLEKRALKVAEGRV